jgi:hypothetical protein
MVEIENQKSQTSTVSLARTSPTDTNNPKSKIENLKSPLDWSVLRERLQSLQHQLRLKGHLDISSMFCSYTPDNLQARLDWVNANPGWSNLVHGMFASEFIHAFARINLNSPW